MTKFIVVKKGLVSEAEGGTFPAAFGYNSLELAAEKAKMAAMSAPGTIQEVYEVVLRGSAETLRATWTPVKSVAKS